MIATHAVREQSRPTARSVAPLKTLDTIPSGASVRHTASFIVNSRVVAWVESAPMQSSTRLVKAVHSPQRRDHGRGVQIAVPVAVRTRPICGRVPGTSVDVHGHVASPGGPQPSAQSPHAVTRLVLALQPQEQTAQVWQRCGLPREVGPARSRLPPAHGGGCCRQGGRVPNREVARSGRC